MSPEEAQCLALLHDLGRMVVPHRYLRTDLVGQRLIQRIGIREELWRKQPPVPSILGRGKAVGSINDLSPAQRLMDVADNLGKRNQDGTLFNEEQMKDYNSNRTERYKEVAWSSERFGISALETGKQKFAISLVKDEIEWFKNKGIDFKKLRQEVEDEFKKPENQEWLFAVKEAQETLDPEIDKFLGRPPIKTIIFDFGNTLTAPFIDERLFEEMAKDLNVSAELIEEAISKMVAEGAMSGVKTEEDYLRDFYREIGKNFSTVEDAKNFFIHPNIYIPAEGMQRVVHRLSNNPQVQVYVLSDAIEPLDIVFEMIRNLYPQIQMDHILISSKISASKRETQNSSFKKFLEQLGNPDSQTVLFIDDLEKYTTSARALWGIRSICFRDNPFGQNASARLENELEKATLIR